MVLNKNKVFMLYFVALLIGIFSAAEASSFQDYIHFELSGENRVGEILIDDRKGGINQGTWLYVKEALEEYKRNKPIFILLKLNTPGGEVFAAQKIADALKQMDTQEGVPIVAVIDNWAISAGAMLAYSARFIVVTKDASMGAAEPILMTPEGGVQTASEKINSALRSDFASHATFFDRSPAIAEAMVDKDIILVKRGEQVIKLDQEGQLKPDDQVISPKGKLLTLTADEMMRLKIADLLMPPEKVLPGKELLFQQPFFKEIPHVVVDRFEMDWKTQFFVFLAEPMVASFLLMGLMIGGYIGLNTGGFGLSGSIAAICLVLIILSSFSQGAMEWFEIILFAGGIALFLVDLVVLPTFGLLGIGGLLMAMVGLIALMLPGLRDIHYNIDSQILNAAGEFALTRLVFLAGAFIVSLGAIAFLSRYIFPYFSPYQRLVLKGGEQEGYRAATIILPPIGSKGVAISSMRPGGKIEIQEEIYDAFTEGEFIEKGTSIIVTHMVGQEIYVRSC